MRPREHAMISFVIVILYSLLVNATLTDLIVLMIIGLVVGVFIDLDHILWALLLNPDMTAKLLASLNARGFIKQFLTTSGHFYNKIIYHKHRYLALHGLWILLMSILSITILQGIGLDYTKILVILVLLVHYICDLSAYL